MDDQGNPIPSTSGRPPQARVRLFPEMDDMESPSTSTSGPPSKKPKTFPELDTGGGYILADLSSEEIIEMLNQEDDEEDENEDHDLHLRGLEDMESFEFLYEPPGSPEHPIPVPAQPEVDPSPRYMHSVETPGPPSPTFTQPRIFTWQNSPPPDRPSFPFTGSQGLKIIPETNDPFEYFKLFFTEAFLQKIVDETNEYARDTFLQAEEEPSPRSRIAAWKEVSLEEFKVFLGINFYMGVVQLPRMKLHWDTSKLFSFPFIRSHMGRDRFQNILKFIHYVKNPSPSDESPQDPLYKIRFLVNFFHDRMLQIHEPGQSVSIDKSLAPWRGRVYFRSYIPNKAHKYGIKLYMLAENDGLIHRFLVYAGAKDQEVGGKGHADKVVHMLMSGLKDSGRSLYMDNYYNSVNLAADLLDQKTFVTGTLRANRKHNPNDVIGKKLSRGDVVQQWTDEGINVTKWKDKRDVLTISTEFSGDLVQARPSTSRRVEQLKPEAVIRYNKHMGGIDRSDQLLSYYIGSRKSLKWYKKLSFHIMELMLLNSFLMFKKYSGVKGFDLLQYRLEIIKNLVGPVNEISSPPPSSLGPKVVNTVHTPRPNTALNASGNRSVQKRCVQCQKSKVSKKTSIVCMGCPGQPGLCWDCFFPYHESLGFTLIK